MKEKNKLRINIVANFMNCIIFFLVMCFSMFVNVLVILSVPFNRGLLLAETFMFVPSIIFWAYLFYESAKNVGIYSKELKQFI